MTGARLVVVVRDRDLRKEIGYRQLLSELSPDLFGDLIVSVYAGAVGSIPFFHVSNKYLTSAPQVHVMEENATFVKAVALKLQPQCYGPLEYICHRYEPAEAMYVLRSGAVSRRGYVIHAGTYFGEDMLLTEYQRPYTVRTLGFVNCYKLDKSDLTALLESEQYPLIQVSWCSLCAS
jgi:hypothetical protein